MAHVSTYPGKLILPDETVIESGAEVTLSKDNAANPTVKGWIAAGWLVDVKAAKTTEADKAE